MLLAKRVTGAFPDMPALRKLYISAFPAKERDPLTALLPVHHDGHDLLAFYHEKEFCGFASLLTYKTITHILYIAICDRFRDHHYGSEAMRILCSRYPGHRILADLETVEPGAPNLDQRKSRVHYYLTAGFRKTDIAYRWQDEDYVIYVHGGDITLPEFQEYWDHFS